MDGPIDFDLITSHLTPSPSSILFALTTLQITPTPWLIPGFTVSSTPTATQSPSHPSHYPIISTNTPSPHSPSVSTPNPSTTVTAQPASQTFYMLSNAQKLAIGFGVTFGCLLSIGIALLAYYLVHRRRRRRLAKYRASLRSAERPPRLELPKWVRKPQTPNAESRDGGGGGGGGSLGMAMTMALPLPGGSRDGVPPIPFGGGAYGGGGEAGAGAGAGGGSGLGKMGMVEAAVVVSEVDGELGVRMVVPAKARQLMGDEVDGAVHPARR